jgi:endonuclease/exonuclease/phosphatase family metal-dependent hydrolase
MTSRLLRYRGGRRAAGGSAGKASALALAAVLLLLLPNSNASAVSATPHLAVAPSIPDGAPTATPTAPAQTHRVWQWNVAGNSLHHGSVDDGLVEAAVMSIVASGSDVAAFNEICRQQYDAVGAALASVGWPQDAGNFARFQTTAPASASICAGNDYGIALFSVSALGTTDRFVLPPDGTGEDRGLLCVPVARTPALRFCTTHITTVNAPAPATGRPANVNQLAAVLNHLEAYHAAAGTVVIAGDFNAQPNYARLDDWYSAAVDGPANGDNTGAYRELDDDDPGHCLGYGEWTATGTPGDTPGCAADGAPCQLSEASGCEKIDLIFVREDEIVGGYGAQPLVIPTTCAGIPADPGVYAAGSCSDHRILTGTVTVRVSS